MWMKILLKLTSKEIACFVMAYPEFLSLISDNYFLKMHVRRFKCITCNSALNCLRESQEMKNFSPLPMASLWCTKALLPSGHCIACLLNPHLLMFSPYHSLCFCVDHRSLWSQLDDIILWSSSSLAILNPASWPDFGSSSIKKKSQ
ncbi:RH4 [Bovine adenovirus 7]|uniref:RH4 protein n=1 Tax=Bovine adenovirus 7 TaxID=10511 RepID=A0A7R7FRK3_ADEB7|nr:RH4 [Bovine adenovirus 7]URN46044.1 RH4 [Bovine adenovirus 7]BCO10943.1 RH4 [Bovine adenovirus 7]BCS90535.1 RH4 [Bovine adenovirus 7]